MLPRALSSTAASLTRSFSSSTSPTSKLFTLHYFFVSNMPEKRQPHRASHLAYLTNLHNEGKLVAGGAYMPACEEGLLIYRAEKKEEVEAFARADPYFLNDLVTDFKVNEWFVPIGKL